jgi:hypothetical protein
MQTVLDCLSDGYNYGESIGAFDVLVQKTRSDKSVETFCGLMIGQKVSFRSAQKTRANLYKWIETMHQDVRNHLITILYQNRCIVDHILSYLSVAIDIDIPAILHASKQTWTNWGVNSIVAKRIVQALTVWQTRGVEKMMSTPSIGIGPWTRKAFAMLYLNEPHHVLHEDLWIRKRWTELCHFLKVPQINLSTLPTSPSNRKYMFTLWRIKKDAVRKLAHRLYSPTIFV